MPGTVGVLALESAFWGHLSSLQFSHSVVSDSLRPHKLQHARPPCPSPTPRVCSNSCPSSLWCHPTISSSVIPFPSCPQSFPASGSFPMRALRIRWPKDWSFSFNISPSNEHPGLISFRMDWYLTKKGKQIKNMNYRNDPNRNFGVVKYNNQNDKLIRVAQWGVNQLKTVSLRLS